MRYQHGISVNCKGVYVAIDATTNWIAVLLIWTQLQCFHWTLLHTSAFTCKMSESFQLEQKTRREEEEQKSSLSFLNHQSAPQISAVGRVSSRASSHSITLNYGGLPMHIIPSMLPSIGINANAARERKFSPQPLVWNKYRKINKENCSWEHTCLDWTWNRGQLELIFWRPCKSGIPHVRSVRGGTCYSSVIWTTAWITRRLFVQYFTIVRMWS